MTRGGAGNRRGLALVCVVLHAAALLACAPTGSGRTTSPASPLPAGPARVELGTAPNSLTFAVIGDFGTGDEGEYETARQLATIHERHVFPLVITVGDNIYGSERPQDFARKFETPFAALLQRGVKFYASLGNHDSREQRYYKPFNMEGKLYYTFKAPRQDVRFFALDTTYPDRQQLDWFEKELSGARERWKIPFFHHPPYSSGRRHGSDPRLRAALEPLFLAHGVVVVFTGHDHVYERTKPQQGITYFVVGSTGQLRPGGLRKGSPLTASGHDADYAFLVVNIENERMTFQAISRAGDVLDSGAIVEGGPSRAPTQGVVLSR